MSEEETWRTLVAEVLRNRENPKYRSTLAALKKGGNPYTETAAYPFVLPWSTGVSQTALLRAIALISQFDGIEQVSGETSQQCFGESLAVASRRMAADRGTTIESEKPDAIAQRLRFMGNLNLEEAVITIRSLLALTEKTGIAVDWYSVTQLILRWGKGISAASQKSRNSALQDYYKHLLVSSPKLQPDLALAE